MPALALATFYMALGGALIYAGVTFINGHFLPSLPLFAQFYTAVGSALARTAVALVLFFGPANLLIAATYRAVPTGVAGYLYVMAMVLGMVATSLFLDGLRLNLMISAGVLVMAAGGYLVIMGLYQ